MIPILLVFGLVAGRWWKSALLVGTFGWPVILVIDGVIDPSTAALGSLGGALGLGLVNTGVGVLVHQGIGWAVRRVRARLASPEAR